MSLFLKTIGFAALFICLTSCKKDPNPPIVTTYTCNTCGVCQPSNAYIATGINSLRFKPGSWWVYQDSVIPGSKDSLYIFDSPQSGIYSVLCPTGFEYYTYHCDGVVNSMQSYMLKGNSFYRSYGFQSSLAPDNLYTDWNAQDTIHTKIDSMFVYDRYYKQVEKLINTADYYEGYQKTVYYTNADAGILRKDIFDTSGVLKHSYILSNKNLAR